MIEDVSKAATIGFKGEGEAIFLIGERKGHLGQSLWMRECHGRQDGPPPPVSLSDEADVGRLVKSLIHHGILTAVHDCSDGGLLVALCEMALAGNIGLSLDDALVAARAFGEDQGLYIVTTRDEEAVIRACGWSFPSYVRLGATGGNSIRVNGIAIPLADLRAAHEGFFPALMGADGALA